MSNQQRIPITILNAINLLRLDDKAREKINDLWRLYLRLYEDDSAQSVEEIEMFIQELYNMSNRTQQLMLNAINQKINSVEREINGNVFNGRGGIKKRKTGKKRKRTNKKTSKKRKRTIKRKTIKGGKDKTPLYLNKTFYLRDEITRQQEEEQEQRRRQLLQQQEIERQERERQERDARQRREELERQERERQERSARQRREEVEAHQKKEIAFWNQWNQF